MTGGLHAPLEFENRDGAQSRPQPLGDVPSNGSPVHAPHRRGRRHRSDRPAEGVRFRGALDGVSLSVPTGTVYGFLGPNGAGKTTTMRLLTGLSQPTDGVVRVCGIGVDDRRALASHVGYLPETPPLYDEFSGREQLDYVADLRDVPGDVADDRIDDYFDRFEVSGDADKRVGEYSNGTGRKTAFVQSVLHDPDILFLDEPTSGLDPRAARRIRETIVEFSEAGTTVFLSTHVLPVVEAVADEVGVLFDGRLLAEGTPAEVAARAETDESGSLEDAFLAVTSDTESATASKVE